MLLTYVHILKLCVYIYICIYIYIKCAFVLLSTLQKSRKLTNLNIGRAVGLEQTY